MDQSVGPMETLTTSKQLEANFLRTMQFLAIDGFEAHCVTDDLASAGMLVDPYALPELEREQTENEELYHVKQTMEVCSDTISQARMYLLDPEVPESYKAHLRAYLTFILCKFQHDQSEEQILREYHD